MLDWLSAGREAHQMQGTAQHELLHHVCSLVQLVCGVIGQLVPEHLQQPAFSGAVSRACLLQLWEGVHLVQVLQRSHYLAAQLRTRHADCCWRSVIRLRSQPSEVLYGGGTQRMQSGHRLVFLAPETRACLKHSPHALGGVPHGLA